MNTLHHASAKHKEKENIPSGGGRLASDVGRRRGRGSKTSHTADTWLWAGLLCMNARVCVWAGMEGGKKIKESGDILVSRTELPQGPLGNYREVAQPHQLFGSSSLVKFRSCRLRLPLVSFCVQIIDCLHLPPCICCMLVLPILSKDLYFQCILYKTSSLKPS